MINKTKLGEDLDFLIEKIQGVEANVEMISVSQDKVLNDIPQLIMMIEALFRLLAEKDIITKDEWQTKIEEVQGLSDAERAKAFIEAKESAKKNYMAWLLTKSKNYGNA